MSFLNYAAREITCKIVYVGPGLGGKTTNVRAIYDRSNPALRGRLVSLDTETERTLFFDFLPLELGSVRGFKVRLQLYSVPGQVFYEASRRLILRGVDGVVFVADSQEARTDANVEALENIADILRDYAAPIEHLPFVVQYNKRDLESALPIEDLRAMLNPRSVPEVAAVASRGEGVFETLRIITRDVVRGLTAGESLAARR